MGEGTVTINETNFEICTPKRICIDNDLPIPMAVRMKRLTLDRSDAHQIKLRLSRTEYVSKELIHARSAKKELISLLTEPTDKE